MKTTQMSLAKEITSTHGGRGLHRSSSLRLAWPPPKDVYAGKTITSNEMDSIVAAARADERKLIGQELHDNVNQILMTVKLYMEMVRHIKQEDKCIQDKSISYLMLAIDEIRTLSGEFTVSKEKKEGLLNNINSIVEDIGFSTKISIEFNHEGDIESMTTDKKQTLLRIVQEQLKNIIKYSEAGKVSIRLIYRRNEAFLQIKDNGIGFNANKKSQGIGLANIFERTRIMDGHVDLQTAPGHGCSLSIFLPA